MQDSTSLGKKKKVRKKKKDNTIASSSNLSWLNVLKLIY